MGHHYLDGLPRTPRFKRVVALLGDSAGAPGATGIAQGSLPQVAEATIVATGQGLQRARKDRAFGYCFFLLAALTQGTRDSLSGGAVQTLFPGLFGLEPGSELGQEEAEYSTINLVSDFSMAVDQFVRRERARTDIGEMAQFAAVECLSALCGPQTNTFFGSTPSTVRHALRKHSTEKGFATLTHDFFSRFTRRFLEYHLSRELSNHVGPDRRFKSVDQHNAFLQQLDEHCQITTGVIRQFAAQWFLKHLQQKDINSRTALGFVDHAIEKIAHAIWYVEQTNGH